MYLARFSYDIKPADRERAIELIRLEVQAAEGRGLKARLLVPLTRALGGPALQFEIELTSLDELERFRQDSGSQPTSRDLMAEFSEILLSPPAVEILRVA